MYSWPAHGTSVAFGSNSPVAGSYAGAPVTGRRCRRGRSWGCRPRNRTGVDRSSGVDAAVGGRVEGVSAQQAGDQPVIRDREEVAKQPEIGVEQRLAEADSRSIPVIAVITSGGTMG